mmetsp:Transcript_118143/g.338915  ORF Transcript_118143/g.338915 Transcript_118143/m.338915 type:complete len:203 (-) Transcript_118143:16-624(-)
MECEVPSELQRQVRGVASEKHLRRGTATTAAGASSVARKARRHRTDLHRSVVHRRRRIDDLRAEALAMLQMHRRRVLCPGAHHVAVHGEAGRCSECRVRHRPHLREQGPGVSVGHGPRRRRRAGRQGAGSGPAATGAGVVPGVLLACVGLSPPHCAVVEEVSCACRGDHCQQDDEPHTYDRQNQQKGIHRARLRGRGAEHGG